MTFLTTRDLQDLIRVDKSTIYRMAEDGRIPAVKIGRQWRFPADKVEAWLHGEAAESTPGALETLIRLILPPGAGARRRAPGRFFDSQWGRGAASACGHARCHRQPRRCKE